MNKALKVLSVCMLCVITSLFVAACGGSSGESAATGGGDKDGCSLPLAPVDISVSAGDGQASVSWNPVPTAASYNIYWSTTSGVTKLSGTKIQNAATPYTHTGLTNGTTYYYVITAVNECGEGNESTQGTAMPSNAPSPPQLPPPPGDQ